MVMGMETVRESKDEMMKGKNKMKGDNMVKERVKRV